MNATDPRACGITTDMTEAEIDGSLLDGVSFLHLDGRNTL
jgi:hypothetical protein